MQNIKIQDVSSLDGGLSLLYSSYDLKIALKNFLIKLNNLIKTEKPQELFAFITNLTLIKTKNMHDILQIKLETIFA